MKNFFSYFAEIFKIIILALLIVVPIRYFVFQPFIVKGASMEPNFENNDYLIIDELTYRVREPERGEIVVFKYPLNPSQRFIKRIIGLPGETIEIKDNKITILDNDKSFILDESKYLPLTTATGGDIRVSLKGNEYFVLGDNRTASFDSRGWGQLPRNNIIGKVILRLWPTSDFTKFLQPEY